MIRIPGLLEVEYFLVDDYFVITMDLLESSLYSAHVFSLPCSATISYIDFIFPISLSGVNFVFSISLFQVNSVLQSCLFV